MKAFLLALGASVALVAPASAHDYSAVGAFDDSVEYLDPSTVKTDGDIKTFRTNLVYIRANDLGIDWTSQSQAKVRSTTHRRGSNPSSSRLRRASWVCHQSC